MNNKYKKSSRSRSREKSPYHRKDKPKYRDNKQRQKQKQRQRYKERSRQHSPKNRRKYNSSSSNSNSNSNQNSSNNSNSQQSHRNKNERRNQHHNSNPTNNNNNINQQPKYKIQQTKTLKIQNYCNLQFAQRALIDASINAGTSVPDEVQQKQGSIYAKYPSIQVSSAVKNKLKQYIVINGEQHRINFYPLKKIDLNVSYDWYCDKCDYKNFARRNKCYRCDNEKNENCKLNYNSTPAPLPNKLNKQQNINNCSLMVRGPIIIETEEQILLDLFQSMCSVKDIRMIKNKMTGQMKDFAFIQFFTPEDAAFALKQASSNQFRVKGQKVSVMYSRNKSQDDYAKPLPYQKRQRRKDINKKDKKNQQVQSYYTRQRQLEIQQQKQRPLITIQQLKQKHEQQLRKKQANVRQLTEQQIKRRQAQMMAKQMQKQAKIQNTVMYICVACRRKFKNQPQMKIHQQSSQFHKYNKQKLQLSI